jgi:hypothetical protein
MKAFGYLFISYTREQGAGIHRQLMFWSWNQRLPFQHSVEYLGMYVANYLVDSCRMPEIQVVSLECLDYLGTLPYLCSRNKIDTRLPGRYPILVGEGFAGSAGAITARALAAPRKSVLQSGLARSV